MSITTGKWIGFIEAVGQLEKHLACNGSNFILDNWKFKYVNARIDMRTGSTLLEPGNYHGSLHDLLSKGGPWLAAGRGVAQWRAVNGDTARWGTEDPVTMSMKVFEEALAAAVAEDRRNRT